jgi:hypothetical protein
MTTEDLKKIWNNKEKILEGFKNAIIKDEYVESIASIRDEICKGCEKYDTQGSSCLVLGTQPCCGECGCSLHLKQRSLTSYCDLGKWNAITEESEN